MKLIQQGDQLFRSVAISKYKYNSYYQISKLTTIKFRIEFNKENTQVNNIWALFFTLGQQPLFKIQNNKTCYVYINLSKLLLSIYIYTYKNIVISKSSQLKKVFFDANKGFIKHNLNWKTTYNHFFRLYIKIEKTLYTSYIIFSPCSKIRFFWEYNQIFI